MNLLHANDRPGAYPDSWYAATARPPGPYPALSGAVRADVAVIGGGYTGLSAALHLARRGYDVALLDAQRIGFGASGRNGGQVGSGQRIDQTDLARLTGPEDAARLWNLGEEAKTLTRTLIATHAINCDLRYGVVEAERTERGVARSFAETELLARDHGYDSVEPLDRDAIRRLVGSPVYAGGTLDRGAFHLHPLRYAFGLARAAESAGARLFERSEVLSLTPGPPAHLVTPGARLQADHVILAAGGYLGGLSPPVAARVLPINNYMVATEPLGDAAADLLAEDVAAADSSFVINYFKRTPDNRLLFGGGESYGYRFPKDIAAKVRPAMRDVFPQLADARIDHAWGGTLSVTRTRLPYVAAPAPNVLSASGYSGHGIGTATLAGAVLAEATAGRSERYDLLARLPVPRFPGGRPLRRPLLTLAMTWFALRDRLGR